MMVLDRRQIIGEGPVATSFKLGSYAFQTFQGDRKYRNAVTEPPDMHGGPGVQVRCARLQGGVRKIIRSQRCKQFHACSMIQLTSWKRATNRRLSTSGRRGAIVRVGARGRCTARARRPRYQRRSHGRRCAEVGSKYHPLLCSKHARNSSEAAFSRSRSTRDARRQCEPQARRCAEPVTQV